MPTSSMLPNDLKFQLRMVDAHTMPQTASSLWEHIAAYLGYKVPRTSVCPNHVAPFDFLSDIFFERQRMALAFANRGGGKTLSVAILCHLKAIHHPLYSLANVAAEKQQAGRCYDYIKEFSDIDNEWFAEDRIFSTQSKTKFRNGSTLEILTGSIRGCKSAHPHLVSCDEIEVMDSNVLQEVLLMPQSTKEHDRILILLSTRQYASGNMYQLLEIKSKQPGWPIKIYPWCLFETVEKCALTSCEQCKEKTRVNDEGKIESWYAVCHDIDKDGVEHFPEGKCRLSDGYILLQDVWEDFITQDVGTFDSQQLCLRPGRKGLVFSSFDRLIHCQDPLVNQWRQRLHHDRWEVEPEKRALEIAVLMDPGWAAPLGVLFVAKDRRDNLFYFDSIYRAELDFRDLKPMILERFDKYNMPHDFPIRCDERASREIADLCNLGLKASAVWLSPAERMRLTRKWLDGNYREGHPGICVDPDTCESFCMELETLKLPLDKEGDPKNEMPARGADHLIDCAGYGFKVLGLAGVGVVIELMRAPEPETNPPAGLQVPTRSDWMTRR